eukprot:Skav227330  [mRNA]  locus=scaffold4115:3298:4404:- [translate_table: standard]
MRLFCILVACLHVLSSASNETNQVGNETIQAFDPSCSRFYFNVKNSCHKTVRMAIRYKKPDGAWKTECWWTISPDASTYLGLAVGDRIVTESQEWQYYAEAIDGTKVWNGTKTAYCGTRRLGMVWLLQTVNSGDIGTTLRCPSGFVGATDEAGLSGSGPNISNISNISSSEGSPKEQVEHMLSSASNETNQVGNETIQARAPSCANRYYINVMNWCHKTVRVAIRYKTPDGVWKTRCWHTISPGVSTFLETEGWSKSRIVTESRVFAYYAETIDGTIQWPHIANDTSGDCSGRTVWMNYWNFVNSNQDLFMQLDCQTSFVGEVATGEAGLSGFGPNISNISSSEGVPKEQVEQIAAGVGSAPTPELLP